jgi:DNA repair protein RadC
MPTNKSSKKDLLASKATKIPIIYADERLSKSQKTISDVRDALLREDLSHLCQDEIELLAFLLSTVVGPIQAATAANNLISQLGSVGAALHASNSCLDRLLNNSQSGVALLRAVRNVAQASLRQRIQDGPLLSVSSDVINYLRFTMAAEEVETLRVLYLDGNKSLISDEIHARGSVKIVFAYPREIARRMIELRSTGILVARTQLSAQPECRALDKEMVISLAHICNSLDTVLLDYVVVASFGSLSMINHQI